MRVYEAIGETLKRLEVQATFGLMGDGNLRFMTYLADELGIPYYAARHEGGAVAMADGYAIVTGRVGVCSVTQGPGVTNTLTAFDLGAQSQHADVTPCGRYRGTDLTAQSGCRPDSHIQIGRRYRRTSALAQYPNDRSQPRLQSSSRRAAAPSRSPSRLTYNGWSARPMD